MRPDRDTYFMLMARVAAMRSTCSRRQVGGVVVDRQARVIATGYNGAPPKFPHCIHVDGDETPCLLAEHDAWNALVHGLPPADLPRVVGGTFYSTDSPCMRCATLLHSAQISRVVFERSYRDATPIEWLRGRAVIVDQWTCPEDWLPLWQQLAL